ncbi:MAG: hypothetical protein R2771_12955 [Saprospiraceae bacterium]
MNDRVYSKEELDYAQSLEFRSDTYDIVNYRIKINATNLLQKY